MSEAKLTLFQSLYTWHSIGKYHTEMLSWMDVHDQLICQWIPAKEDKYQPLIPYNREGLSVLVLQYQDDNYNISVTV